MQRPNQMEWSMAYETAQEKRNKEEKIIASCGHEIQIIKRYFFLLVQSYVLCMYVLPLTIVCARNFPAGKSWLIQSLEIW